MEKNYITKISLLIVILLMTRLDGLAQQEAKKSIFTFMTNRNVPVKCKCDIKRGTTVIKQITTDDKGSIDLSEYCDDESITITYTPFNISFSGNTLKCNRASKTVPVYEVATIATLEYNGFDLLGEEPTARYKLIAAGARTELAEIARKHGMIEKSNELESSAIVLIAEALSIDKGIALYRDENQEDKIVLSNEGVALIKNKQKELGTQADGILGAKTISEAALFQTSWLYTNRKWKSKGLNSSIASGSIK